MAEIQPDRNVVEQLNEANDSHSVSATDSQISVDFSVLENSIVQQMTAMATEVKETILSLKEHVEMRFVEFDNRMKKTESQLIEYGRKIGLYNPGGGFLTEPAVNTLSCDTQCSGALNVAHNHTQTSKANRIEVQCENPNLNENCLLTKGDNLFKVKLQCYSGTEDPEDFLVYFNTLAELYGWSSKAKSLYLASSLIGPARSLLTEMTLDERRDYQTLVQKLSVRFGSANKCELFRAQLKTREQRQDESISELAVAIRKMARLAYPNMLVNVVEMLAVGCFVDALNQPDLRLRLREINPKTLSEAETFAIKVETLREADKHIASFKRKVKQNCVQSHAVTVLQERNLADRLDVLQRQLEELSVSNMTQNYQKYGQNGKPYATKKKFRRHSRRRRFQQSSWPSQ